MSVLFNTTVHAGMNDISVTTGNADGWVLVVRGAVMPIERPAPTTRRGGDATKDAGKRKAK